MTEPEPSPLERMLAAWIDDRDRGEVGPVADYLRLFEEAEAPPEPAIARREDAFGPYRLIEVLGQGGQATVWLAEDTRLSRRVALKLVPPHRHDSHLHFERFRREAQIASRLDHPAICAVYETGTEDDVPYIAMRHVEGETFQKRLRDVRREAEGDPGLAASQLVTERFSNVDSGADTEVSAPTDPEPTASRTSEATSPEHPGALLRFLEECARALHVAHEAGIVHRDFKPGNVIVTPKEEPVILDFGLARDDTLDPGLTQSDDVFGTPAYMAPEQLEGKRVDRRTDVWALGVTLYESLALERPFQGATRLELQHEILEKDPPTLRSRNRAVSRDLEVVVATALEKDPDRRYRSALALAEDLRRVREHHPISVRPAGPVIKLRRWIQRNPGIAAAVIISFVAIILGLVAALAGLGAAESQLRDYESLRDGRAAREQVQAADALWPALPDRVPEMDAWLVTARRLEASLPDHRRRLEELEASSDEAAALRCRVLREVIVDLEELATLLPTIAERRELAATLRQRTIEAHREAWDDAIDAVARSAHFGGLRPAAQIGLVPLGPDPESGLQEFAHALSGVVPKRGEDGKLEVDATSALVLVLVPGGEITLGYQTRHEDRPGYVAPDAVPFSLRPVPAETRVETISPFFVSKYEMTQAQWQRATGENPSLHRTARTAPLHPVERITRPEAQRCLERLDLTLPSSAQWTRAARGATRTLWWTGDDRLAAARRANTADARFAAAFPRRLTRPVDDGFAFSAPVTALAQNPFGLTGVIGNVSEWCRDPETAGPDPSHFLYRGGNFGSPVELGCSAARGRSVRDVRAPTIGVRPVRALR